MNDEYNYRCAIIALICGIVEDAIVDYMKYTVFLKNQPIRSLSSANTQQLIAYRRLKDAIKFFHSDWFVDLVNGAIHYEWIIKKMNDKLDDGLTLKVAINQVVSHVTLLIKDAYKL